VIIYSEYLTAAQYLHRNINLMNYAVNILVKTVSFWATVCKTVRPMLSAVVYPVRLFVLCCLSCLVCLWRWCIVAKMFDGAR